jgi:LmeA-like phospholipid-binding
MSRSRRPSAVRGLAVLVVVLGLVVVGLYFGDRYARARVEARAAAQLEQQLGTPDPPQVHIAGTPFLTQVAARSIGSVHVVAEDLGATTDAAVEVQNADLTLTDVTTTDWFTTMTAGHAEGTAHLDYAELEKLAGMPLTYVGNGRVQVTESTRVFEQPVKAVITGHPELDVSTQTITLTSPKITVAGINLPDFVAEALLKTLLKPIPVRGVPLGLTLSGLTAADDGVHVEVVGDNLPIGR